MRYPALVPAAGLLTGVTAGCFVGVPWWCVGVALAGCWTTACICLCLERPWLVLAATSAGFCAAGWLIGADANDRAQHSTLRAFFDREVEPLGVRADPVWLEGT